MLSQQQPAPALPQRHALHDTLPSSMFIDCPRRLIIAAVVHKELLAPTSKILWQWRRRVAWSHASMLSIHSVVGIGSCRKPFDIKKRPWQLPCRASDLK